MKYQSEIIKNLIDNDGHHVTTNPHYEVECINEIINDVRGSYPKLCDYMGEWMNYANEHVDIGKFPIERVTDVTNARFENVVPYGYKSAILKGQTLVNLATQKSGSFNGTRFLDIPLSRALKANTKYFVNFNVKESTLTQGVVCRLKYSGNISFVGSLNSSGIITTNALEFDSIQFYIKNANDVANGLDAIVDDIMVIEYQEGMENWNIPFFEGMKSVQMPVLTTTGENLWDDDWSKGLTQTNGSVTTGGTYDGFRYNNNLICVSGINTLYLKHFCPQEGVSQSFRIGQYGKNKEWLNKPLIHVPVNGIIKVPSGCEYVRIHVDLRYNGSATNTDDSIPTMMVVSTSEITDYEPYKSNILTVNEEVELRGIGAVKDTLDLTTGELLSNFDEITFDGSENWIVSSTSDTVMRFYLNTEKTSNALHEYGAIQKSDKFHTKVGSPAVSNEDSYMVPHPSGSCWIVINKNKLISEDLLGFKNWLKSNKPTFIYQTNPTIKTVELSCLDENNTPTKFKPYEGVMYVQTSSETLPPLLDMEVPVEAISQNLASFIK